MASNSTNTETVSWQVNQGRGTWDIISSCIFTLVLCVWTALHLNVPKQNATLWDRFKTKTLWVVIGIFAPEVVVYTAWVQYSSAKYLLRRIQNLGADGTTKSDRACKHKWRKEKKKGMDAGDDVSDSSMPITASKKHRWTLSHCYFALMGGFAFDSGIDNDGQEFIPGSPSLRFTSHAILLLAQLDKLPNISSAEVSDKSKADGLAKSLVCLQASWIMLQSVARLVQHLPITLLEINTLGHCFCALIIYLIWWNKPLHVLEPINLTGEWIRGFTSYSWMCSTMISETFGEISDLGLRTFKTFRQQIAFKRELDKLQFLIWDQPGETASSSSSAHSLALVPYTITSFEAQKNNTWDRVSSKKALFEGRILSKSGESFAANFPSGSLLLCEGEAISGLNFAIRPAAVDQLSNSYVCGYKVYKRQPRRHHLDRKFVLQLSKSDLARWTYATNFLNSVWGIADREIFEDSYHALYLEQYHLVVTEVSNLYKSSQNVSGKSTVRIGIYLTIASSAYGGLHMSSWHAHFPTVVEKWLWIASSAFIAFAGFLLSVAWGSFDGYNFVLENVFMLDDSWKRGPWRPAYLSIKWIGKLASRISRLAVVSVCGNILKGAAISFAAVFGPLYFVTRAFIVIEAFISLRSLPLSYYDTPVWSNFIPHL